MLELCKNPVRHQRAIHIGFSLAWGVVFFLIIPSCSLQPTPADNDSNRVQQLNNELISLLGYQNKETLLLAQTALTRTNSLARNYNITGPPLFHNFLVHIGLRNRGLCCHWTEDLITTLNDMNLKQFHFIWVVSNFDSFREHSSIAVVPIHKELKDGLILDPWRNAGRLYWSRIMQDRYNWMPHPGYTAKNRTISCRNTTTQ